MRLLSTVVATLSFGGLVAITLGSARATGAAHPAQGALYEVTVTNLTRNQPLSPLLVATHDTGTALFRLGSPSSDELRLLAEEGDNSALAGVLAHSTGVGEVVGGAAPIGPGASETLVISASGKAARLSLAGMLVNTNDAFAALDSMRLPRHGTESVLIPAFDCGTEANNELCAFIPGPACGASGVRDVSGAEGFVHVHSGIHGTGDLAPETYDWRNPTALVTVTRIR